MTTIQEELAEALREIQNISHEKSLGSPDNPAKFDFNRIWNTARAALARYEESK